MVLLNVLSTSGSESRASNRTPSCEDSESEGGESSAEVLLEEGVRRHYHSDLNGMLQLPYALSNIAYFL